jgi:hypothetical protein
MEQVGMDRMIKIKIRSRGVYKQGLMLQHLQIKMCKYKEVGKV